MATTGEKLRAWRKEQGRSLEWFSGKVGCSPAALWNFEMGLRVPWLSVGLAIEKLTLGVVKARHWPARKEAANG